MLSAFEDERALMDAVAGGDRRAQAELVDRLLPRIFRLTRVLLGQDAQCDDATQESLMEILASAGSFRGEASIERWADRVAARTTLRWAKRDRRSQHRLANAADPDDLRERSPSSDLLERAPRSVVAYLESLSPPKREVLVLRHVLDYGIAEIAELSGTSPNTIKDRLQRARREFRRLLRREISLGYGRRRQSS